jgi:glycosyltransferase involved in cell wall biosynthesis
MVSTEEKPLSLVLVLPVRKTTSPPPFWLAILNALENLGVQTEVVTAGVRPPKNGELTFRRRVLPSPRFVSSLIRSSAPVLLCIEYGVPTLIAAVIARLTRRRTVIFQEHQGRGNRHVPLRPWERGYRQLVIALSAAVVANTDAAYEELVSLAINRTKIVRATLLVPLERSALSLEPGSLPEPSWRPLFLFVGRLVQSKNVSCLLAAAAAIRARGLEFELWIVGEGPERPKLETQAAPLVNEGLVRFLGPRPNSAIGSAYEAADVFVMPTLRDYRSVAVLEALRFGTPVIVSACDGNAGDSVRHERTGLVFDPYEAGSLSRAMERLFVEPELFTEMGKRASAVMDTQTPSTAAAAVQDILRALETPR